MKFLCLAAALAVILAPRPLPAVTQAAAVDPDAVLAARLLKDAGAGPGVCVLLGARDARLGLELVRAGRFLVHLIDPDAGAVAAARDEVDAAGFDARQIVVEQMGWNALPHADRTVDLIVATRLSPGQLAQLRPAELRRVLRPLGTAILGARRGDGGPPLLAVSQLAEWWRAAAESGGEPATARTFEEGAGCWLQITRPQEAGIDEWTHWEHAPDNNAVSTDTVIQAPYLTQWLGNPLYIAMPAITTAAGGRLFLAMGHIAHHEREEPWLNTLLACNGYNGTELWRRKLPDGYLVHRSAFVATAETFYMIDPDGAGCLLLDPRTGEERDRIRVPEVAGDWKWIALRGDVLYALVGKVKDPPETTIVRSEDTHWSWGELSRGYYQRRVPWGFGETLLACSLSERNLRWLHREDAPVDSRALVMGDGRLFFYGPDSRAGCLDAGSGTLAWANDDDAVRALIEEPGRGLGSTPGFRTSCYSLYTPEALLFQAQTQMNVVALSPQDGHLLWSKRKTTNNPNMLYVDGLLLVGIGPDGETLAVKPATGEVVNNLGFKKRSCARLTATPDSLFCRGWPEGLTRYDRRTGAVQFNGALRPACNDGVIGAHGLLYTGPWLCDCNLSLMGRVTLCSAGDFQFDIEPAAAERLERGADEGGTVAPFDVAPGDWPCYRGGSARRSATATAVPAELAPIWTHQPQRPFQPTAPVAAGDLLFLAGTDGKVRALDALTGQPRWSYRTGGPVLQPPTVWNGRAYVGSGDGFVYALEAATGRLLWRFRAAPRERRIMVYDALCSTWPVNSGVLVEDGIAYAAAGIIDTDGTYVYALDAVTGKVVWQNSSSGHLRKDLRKGVSAQGMLTTARGRLWMPGGNVVSPAAYDLRSGEYAGDLPEDGSPRANRGEEIGVIRDDYLLYGGRLRYSATENVVNPGTFTAVAVSSDGRGGRQMPLLPGKIPPAWDDRHMVFVRGRRTPPECCDAATLGEHLTRGDARASLPSRWRADALRGSDTVGLVLAENCVVAVHQSPVPRAREARWNVSTLDRETGALIAQQPLPGAALAGGVLVGRQGQIVVALADGAVACYGSPGLWQARLERLRNWVQETPSGRPEAIRMLRADLDAVHEPRIRQMIIDDLAALGLRAGEEACRAGFVSGWHLLGPVPWDEAENNLDRAFVGEPEVELTTSYAVGPASLSWREYTTAAGDGTVDLAAVYGPHEGKAVYACADVMLPRAGDLLLKVGSNDGFKCWFNGQEVGRFDGGRAYVPEQDALRIRGRAGANRVLLKISQLGAAWAFGARLTYPDGAPVDLASAPARAGN